MAKIIENEKGFRVIEVSMIDIARIGGMGICDWCNGAIGKKGYYVAVLNTAMCEKCYNEWYERAVNYPEDGRVEAGNFLYMKNLLNL